MSELVEIVARVLAERNGVRQWQVCAKDAAAALRAIEGAGYKVVGREATIPVYDAITAAMLEAIADPEIVVAKHVYRAAFDAALTVGGGDNDL